jgi:FkbM family methyltransferase
VKRFSTLSDDLLPFESNGLRLHIRRRYEQAETMIVREVQSAYAWDFPITNALDIGAHIGSWTLEAKRRHPAAQIVAVEVDPDNMALLRHNVESIEGVQAVHMRCGYVESDVVVGQHRYNSGSHRVYQRFQIESILAKNPNWDFVESPPLRTPEDLIAQAGLSAIDTLKIDCEGCEIEIFQHMSDDMLDSIQHIVGEIHTYPRVFGDLTYYRLQHVGFQVVYTPHPANPQYSTFHAWRAS